jgi:hypothetical protein
MIAELLAMGRATAKVKPAEPASRAPVPAGNRTDMSLDPFWNGFMPQDPHKQVPWARRKEAVHADATRGFLQDDQMWRPTRKADGWAEEVLAVEMYLQDEEHGCGSPEAMIPFEKWLAHGRWR